MSFTAAKTLSPQTQHHAASGPVDSQATAQWPAGLTDQTQSPLVLRVLTGKQQGAQAPMRQQRLLVGNLEEECDVVLALDRCDRHACLIRASQDGWTVMNVTGDLWVGDTPVPPQQTHGIASGVVMTLAGVCFCVADTRSVDWPAVRASLTPPMPSPQASFTARPAANRPDTTALHTKTQQGWLQKQLGEHFPRKVSSVSAPSLWAMRLGWGAVAALISLALALLVLSGSGTWPRLSSTPTAQQQEQALAQALSTLKQHPWAQELTAQIDPQNVRRVLLGGYLPQRTFQAPLESTLQGQGLKMEHRWVAVDELKKVIANRLSPATPGAPVVPNAPPTALPNYAGQGRFVLSTASADVPALDAAIRKLLQDTPAVQAVDLQLTDLAAAVHYQRDNTARQGVAVTGLDALVQPPPAPQWVVQEVRLGRLPSVVMDDGARYFEGSTLPSGALLYRIEPTQLTLQRSGKTEKINIQHPARVVSTAEFIWSSKT